MLRNRMDAEDVTQEVLIRLWNNISKFNLLAAKTWIMRTTHNLCIDHLRKKNAVTRNEMLFEDDSEELFEDSSRESNPYVRVVNNLIQEEIKEALFKMPEKLRSIFVLYHLHGMKYREISKMLGIPLNTVKVNLLRARKRLQKELIKNEYQEVV